jgi:hypothetical protein
MSRATVIVTNIAPRTITRKRSDMDDDDFFDEEEEGEEQHEEEGEDEDVNDIDIKNNPDDKARTPDKSIRQLAFLMIRSHHPYYQRTQSNEKKKDPMFVLTDEFCITVHCARRRIYDVANVLEGIGFFGRNSMKIYNVLGVEGMRKLMHDMQLRGVASLACTYNRSGNFATATRWRRVNGKHENDEDGKEADWLAIGGTRDFLKNVARSLMYALVQGLFPPAQRNRKSWTKGEFQQWIAVQCGRNGQLHKAIHRRVYDVLNVFQVVNLVQCTQKKPKLYTFSRDLRDMLPDEYQLELVKPGHAPLLSPPFPERTVSSSSSSSSSSSFPHPMTRSRSKKQARITSTTTTTTAITTKRISVGPPLAPVMVVRNPMPEPLLKFAMRCDDEGLDDGPTPPKVVVHTFLAPLSPPPPPLPIPVFSTSSSSSSSSAHEPTGNWSDVFVDESFIYLSPSSSSSSSSSSSFDGEGDDINIHDLPYPLGDLDV